METGLNWRSLQSRGRLMCICKRTSGHIKCGEFLKSFHDYLLLKRDSVPWSQSAMGAVYTEESPVSELKIH